MEGKELNKVIDDLGPRVERLKSLYQQYFMGIEKMAPNVLRKDVDRTIWQLRKIRFQNTRLRFRFQQIIQRYNTYKQFWSRTLREIENGTYKRHVIKAAKRFGKDALEGASRNLDRNVERAVAEGEEKPKQKVWDLLDETPTPASVRGAHDSPDAAAQHHAAQHGQYPPGHDPYAAQRAAQDQYHQPAHGQQAYGQQAHGQPPGHHAHAQQGHAQQQQHPGYPPMQDHGQAHKSGGYSVHLGQAAGGQPPNAGHPPPAGYPPNAGHPPPAGYPQQHAGHAPPQPAGYPQAGYPPQQAQGHPQPAGYPPAGYPPQQAQGHPQQQAGYPPQQAQGHPQQAGYPPQQHAARAHPQQAGYPPVQAQGHPQPAGYPPHQGAAPRAAAGPEPTGRPLPPRRPATPPQRPTTPAPRGSGAGGRAAPSPPPVQQSNAGQQQPAGRRAPPPPARRPPPPPPPPRRSAEDERTKRIYDQYLEAKHRTGESIAGLTYEKLKKSLDSQTKKLRQKHGAGKSIDYEVVEKNGRAVLRPKVKK